MTALVELLKHFYDEPIQLSNEPLHVLAHVRQPIVEPETKMHFNTFS